MNSGTYKLNIKKCPHIVSNFLGAFHREAFLITFNQLSTSHTPSSLSPYKPTHIASARHQEPRSIC
jgi:hypothetical protein